MARFRFRDGDGCTVGAIDFDVDGAPGRITVAAVGGDKADALGRAALVAERIASDPIMAALMPPQALVAIKAAKGLAAAAKRGSRWLRKFRRKLKGPGAKRLAKVLHAEAAVQEGVEVGDVAGLWSGIKKVGRGVKKVGRGIKKVARYHPAAIVARKIRGKKKKRGKVPPMQRPVEPEPEEPEEMEPEQMEPDNQSPDDGGGYDESDDGGDYADEGEE